GRRLRSSEPGGRIRRYVVDPTSKPYRTCVETDDSGVPLTEYTFGGGLLEDDRGGSVRYYHYDGLGSTAALTDSAGNDVGHLGYAAFGDTLLALGATRTRPPLAGRLPAAA